MNIRSFALVSGLFIAALSARADINIEAVISEAKLDLEKAPAVVAKAAAENTNDLNGVMDLVKKSVEAIPSKIIDITCAVCKSLPDSAPEIVRAALSTVPEEKQAAIVVAVADCVPAKVREALVAPTAAAAAPAAPIVIPLPQPINPDVVSPSS